MADIWDGRFILRPPRDHGSAGFTMAYADAEAVTELSGVNFIAADARQIPKSSYRAALVRSTGRNVRLVGRPGTMRMHVYQLERIR